LRYGEVLLNYAEAKYELDENGLIDYWVGFLPNGYQFRENQDYLYSIP
jgi:hypothetical protein